MKCERVRESLADFLDGRCGPFLRSRVRRHVDRCPGCAAALREDARLDEVLGSWKDVDPSPAIWTRICEAVEESSAHVPETMPVAWWARVRVAATRYVIPYALGAATTALLILAGLGRTEPERSRERPIVHPEPGIMVNGDPAGVFPAGGLTGESPGSAALRPGEMQLREERARDAVLIFRRMTPEQRARYEQFKREGRIPASDEPETPLDAEPASYSDRTH